MWSGGPSLLQVTRTGAPAGPASSLCRRRHAGPPPASCRTHGRGSSPEKVCTLRELGVTRWLEHRWPGSPSLGSPQRESRHQAAVWQLVAGGPSPRSGMEEKAPLLTESLVNCEQGPCAVSQKYLRLTCAHTHTVVHMHTGTHVHVFWGRTTDGPPQCSLPPCPCCGVATGAARAAGPHQPRALLATELPCGRCLLRTRRPPWTGHSRMTRTRWHVWLAFTM